MKPEHVSAGVTGNEHRLVEAPVSIEQIVGIYLLGSRQVIQMIDIGGCQSEHLNLGQLPVFWIGRYQFAQLVEANIDVFGSHSLALVRLAPLGFADALLFLNHRTRLFNESFTCLYLIRHVDAASRIRKEEPYYRPKSYGRLTRSLLN